MLSYKIISVEDLTNIEILLILDLWNIDAWKFMEPSEFKSRFRESEIHFLIGENDSILSLARISFDFTLKISGTDYRFTEFAGLVSSQKHKGFGSILMSRMIENLQERGINSIGFCEKKLRPFYEKSGIILIHDAACFIFEYAEGEMVKSTLDDIIILNLDDSLYKILTDLNNRNIAVLYVGDKES